MDIKKLRIAYNRITTGYVINLRELYGIGHPLDAMLPEAAIEITKEDYEALQAIYDVRVEIRYLNETNGDSLITRSNLLMFDFEVIDERFYVSGPNLRDGLQMELLDKYIQAQERWERIREVDNDEL